MSNLQAGLRSLANSSTGPVEIVTRLNRLFYTNRLTNKFFTLFHRILDLDRIELIYSNAGHLPPLVRHSNGELSSLKDSGGLVGCFPEWTYQQESICLGPGDRIWLYTDCLSEARTAEGGDFGPSRMESLIDELHAFTLA